MATAPNDLPKDKAKCVAPIPVPTHGAGGNFAVACSTTMAAPALQCLEKVLDLSSYPDWNTFIPTASVLAPGPDARREGLAPELVDLASRPGYVSPGARIRFNAVMTPGSSRATDLEVTFLEAFDDDGRGKGYRVVWRALGFPRFVLYSERVQEFVEIVGDDGGVVTRYDCWETFGGALAYVLPKGQLEDGFERWMEGLKRVVEEGK